MSSVFKKITITHGVNDSFHAREWADGCFIENGDNVYNPFVFGRTTDNISIYLPFLNPLLHSQFHWISDPRPVGRAFRISGNGIKDVPRPIWMPQGGPFQFYVSNPKGVWWYIKIKDGYQCENEGGLQRTVINPSQLLNKHCKCGGVVQTVIDNVIMDYAVYAKSKHDRCDKCGSIYSMPRGVKRITPEIKCMITAPTPWSGHVFQSYLDAAHVMKLAGVEHFQTVTVAIHPKLEQ